MWIFLVGPCVHGEIRRGIRLGIPHPRDGIGTGRNQHIESAHCLPGGKIAGPDFMVLADGKGGPDGSPEKPRGFPGPFKSLARRGRQCAST
jgi:hypothetical protein